MAVPTPVQRLHEFELLERRVDVARVPVVAEAPPFSDPFLVPLRLSQPAGLEGRTLGPLLLVVVGVVVVVVEHLARVEHTFLVVIVIVAVPVRPGISEFEGLQGASRGPPEPQSTALAGTFEK